MNPNDHTPNIFSDAMKELQIGKSLRKSSITKARKESIMHKINAWFTTEPMQKEILLLGIDAIGIVKQLKPDCYCIYKIYDSRMDTS